MKTLGPTVLSILNGPALAVSIVPSDCETPPPAGESELRRSNCLQPRDLAARMLVPLEE